MPSVLRFSNCPTTALYTWECQLWNHAMAQKPPTSDFGSMLGAQKGELPTWVSILHPHNDQHQQNERYGDISPSVPILLHHWGNKLRVKSIEILESNLPVAPQEFGNNGRSTLSSLSSLSQSSDWLKSTPSRYPYDRVPGLQPWRAWSRPFLSQNNWRGDGLWSEYWCPGLFQRSPSQASFRCDGPRTGTWADRADYGSYVMQIKLRYHSCSFGFWHFFSSAACSILYGSCI